jgi:hypothetical protein
VSEGGDLEVHTVDDNEYCAVLNTGIDNPEPPSSAAIANLGRREIGCKVEICCACDEKCISHGAAHQEELCRL